MQHIWFSGWVCFLVLNGTVTKHTSVISLQLLFWSRSGFLVHPLKSALPYTLEHEPWRFWKKSMSIDLLGPLIFKLVLLYLQITNRMVQEKVRIRTTRKVWICSPYFLSISSTRVQCLLVLNADLLAWNAKVNSAVWKVCQYGKHFPRGTPSWFHLTACSSSRAPALPHNRPWTHLWLQPHRFTLEHLGVSSDVRSHRRAWVRLEEPLEGVCSYGAPHTFSFFVSVPQTITAQQRVGENPRFIVEPEFLFSQSRSFLLMVFSKIPFSPALCQKMALLRTEHSSPLQQVIKRSGKTAAWKSIRLAGNKFAFISHIKDSSVRIYNVPRSCFLLFNKKLVFKSTD